MYSNKDRNLDPTVTRPNGSALTDLHSHHFISTVALSFTLYIHYIPSLCFTYRILPWNECYHLDTLILLNFIYSYLFNRKYYDIVAKVTYTCNGSIFIYFYLFNRKY